MKNNNNLEKENFDLKNEVARLNKLVPNLTGTNTECEHKNIQQFTECCLDCGKNIYVTE